MRKFKLSFALVIAILAVGVTAATQAKTFGKKFVADCFQVQAAPNTAIQLTDAATTPNLETLVLGEAAATADADIIASPYLRVSVTASPVEQADVCDQTDDFCCVQFTLAQAGDPNFANIPTTTVNGLGSGKWKVSAIHYRN